MKNKTLKKMIMQAVALKLAGEIAKSDEVHFLNNMENEHTKGGFAQDNCPNLNKSACNPYGVCSINLTLKKKKRHRKSQ